MADLGRRMYSQNLVLRGRLAAIAWRSLLVECVEAMGMKTAGTAVIWSYPIEEGKGGNGATICQPMVESFAVIDTWPDHDGAYLHISSCVQFDPGKLIAPVRAAGLAIDFVGKPESLQLHPYLRGEA